ncbi:chromatin-silencing protein SIR4 Ecym_4126 [Eremothecium cymbalariae DBVPG|uniref:Sir4 SID domain-containing protein n=1 Tax=Eremothecium cymbalariae (strain CBS 270.75 / DBVPG 7215 / KCTC 17166 / NRRL Y-17582) TaxID=931890 RepID=G8JT52_ERECY|nr:hypothetical protein Ecym_4126 [Eremothecium cymbalariae DBVPG\
MFRFFKFSQSNLSLEESFFSDENGKENKCLENAVVGDTKIKNDNTQDIEQSRLDVIEAIPVRNDEGQMNVKEDPILPLEARSSTCSFDFGEDYALGSAANMIPETAETADDADSGVVLPLNASIKRSRNMRKSELQKSRSSFSDSSVNKGKLEKVLTRSRSADNMHTEQRLISGVRQWVHKTEISEKFSPRVTLSQQRKIPTSFHGHKRVTSDGSPGVSPKNFTAESSSPLSRHLLKQAEKADQSYEKAPEFKKIPVEQEFTPNKSISTPLKLFSNGRKLRIPIYKGTQTPEKNTYGFTSHSSAAKNLSPLRYVSRAASLPVSSNKYIPPQNTVFLNGLADYLDRKALDENGTMPSQKGTLTAKKITASRTADLPVRLKQRRRDSLTPTRYIPISKSSPGMGIRKFARPDMQQIDALERKTPELMEPLMDSPPVFNLKHTKPCTPPFGLQNTELTNILPLEKWDASEGSPKHSYMIQQGCSKSNATDSNSIQTQKRAAQLEIDISSDSLQRIKKGPSDVNYVASMDAKSELQMSQEYILTQKDEYSESGELQIPISMKNGAAIHPKDFRDQQGVDILPGAHSESQCTKAPSNPSRKNTLLTAENIPDIIGNLEISKKSSRQCQNIETAVLTTRGTEIISLPVQSLDASAQEHLSAEPQGAFNTNGIRESSNQEIGICSSIPQNGTQNFDSIATSTQKPYLNPSCFDKEISEEDGQTLMGEDHELSSSSDYDYLLHCAPRTDITRSLPSSNIGTKSTSATYELTMSSRTKPENKQEKLQDTNSINSLVENSDEAKPEEVNLFAKTHNTNSSTGDNRNESVSGERALEADKISLGENATNIGSRVSSPSLNIAENSPLKEHENSSPKLCNPFAKQQKTPPIISEVDNNPSSGANLDTASTHSTSAKASYKWKARSRDWSEISEANTLPTNRSIDWIFSVVPKPIINGYSRFCQSMEAEGKGDAVKGALQRLLDVAETCSAEKKIDVKNSKWISSRTYYTRDQLKIGEMLEGFMNERNKQPKNNNNIKTSTNSDEPIEISDEENCNKNIDNNSSDEFTMDEDEGVLRAFYELMNANGYDPDRRVQPTDNTADYSKSSIDLKKKMVNVESDDVIEPDPDEEQLRIEHPSKLEIISLVDSRCESENSDDEALNTMLVHPTHTLSRSLDKGKCNKKVKISKGSLILDPETLRKKMELVLYNRMKKRTSLLRRFTKENIISFVQEGICDHAPQSQDRCVSATNNICNVNNYESSAIFHFQNPKSLLYFRYNDLPYPSDNLPRGVISMNSENIITPRKVEFVDHSSLGTDELTSKKGTNISNVGVFSSSEGLNPSNCRNTFQKKTVTLYSSLVSQTSEFTSRRCVPEIDDDAFSFPEFDIPNCEIFLDRCEHTNFLTDLFSAGFQTLGAKIVDEASWKVKTAETSIQFFDGKDIHPLTYKSVVQRIPILSADSEIKTKLASCNCKTSQETNHTVDEEYVPESNCDNGASRATTVESALSDENSDIKAGYEIPMLLEGVDNVLIDSPKIELRDPETSSVTAEDIYNSQKNLSELQPSWTQKLKGIKVWIDPFNTCSNHDLINECISMFKMAGASLEYNASSLDPEFSHDVDGIYIDSGENKEIWSFTKALEYFKTLPLDTSIYGELLKHYKKTKEQQATAKQKLVHFIDSSDEDKKAPLTKTPKVIPSKFPSICNVWKQYKAYYQPWFQQGLKAQDKVLSEIIKNDSKTACKSDKLASIVSGLSSEVIANQIQIASLKGQLAHKEKLLALKEKELQTLLIKLEGELDTNHKKEELLVYMKGTQGI